MWRVGRGSMVPERLRGGRGTERIWGTPSDGTSPIAEATADENSVSPSTFAGGRRAQRTRRPGDQIGHRRQGRASRSGAGSQRRRGDWRILCTVTTESPPQCDRQARFEGRRGYLPQGRGGKGGRRKGRCRRGRPAGGLVCANLSLLSSRRVGSDDTGVGASEAEER